jgi:1-acyl-sn-glycerol-3-phosphate acyltransferase
MNPLYLIGWSLTLGIARLVFRMSIYRRENIPAEDSFILACNHISLADPPLVGSSLSRPIHFMAKEELFRNRFFGGLISRVNAHPLKRDRIDRAAYETAYGILDRGQPLLIFPEGTRSKAGRLRPPRPGIGMIARKTLSPVIPAYINGSNRLSACFFGKEKLGIIFGQLLDKKEISSYTDDKSGYRKLADEIMDRIGKLRNDFYKETGKANMLN